MRPTSIYNFRRPSEDEGRRIKCNPGLTQRKEGRKSEEGNGREAASGAGGRKRGREHSTFLGIGQQYFAEGFSIIFTFLLSTSRKYLDLIDKMQIFEIV